MKKTLLSIVLLTLCCTQLIAQDDDEKKKRHMYLRAGAGYSFPHGTQTDFNGNLVSGKINTTPAYTEYAMKKVSFSTGVTIAGALGYMINDYVGVELGVSLGIVNREYKYNYEAIQPPDIMVAAEGKIAAKTRLTVLPSLVLQAPLGGVEVYSRVGVALPVIAKVKMEYLEIADAVGGTYETATAGEFTTMFSLGLQGAAGVKFPLGFGAFWAEVNMLSMNLYAKSFLYDKYSINGDDVLDMMPRYDQETQFDFDGTAYSSVSNPEEPRKARTFSFPFSNVGAAVGISVDL